MNKYEIYDKLNKGIKDIENVNNQIAMIELAIYQKSIVNLKEAKINEVKELFKQQALFYNQKIEQYKNEIDKIIQEYDKEMERIIRAYNSLYITVFKIKQSSLDNQKIAVANIVTLSEKRQVEELEDEQVQIIKRKMLACAEKKLNYAVIIEECEARLRWCTENIQKDINEVFINNIYQLQPYQDNIIIKIRRLFSNTIFGKSNYKKFIKNYEEENFRNIRLKNSSKILDINATLRGIIKQTEEMREKISEKYNKKVV